MKLKLSILLMGGALAAATASATPVSGISSFTATANTENANGFVFGNTPAIATNFTPGSNTATITNTVITCANSEGCSGTVVNFSLAASFDPTLPLVISIDGTLTGETNATGTLSIQGLSIPSFSINTGSFNTTILSTLVPGGNLFISNASLDLSMANGQVLTLPSSFSITVNASAAPEPGTMALMGSGLLGLAVAVRRRRA
ncbi:MAG: PEP-CTERM sorting domain-containing protein [Acidobacteriota bacterium]